MNILRSMRPALFSLLAVFIFNRIYSFIEWRNFNTPGTEKVRALVEDSVPCTRVETTLKDGCLIVMVVNPPWKGNGLENLKGKIREVALLAYGVYRSDPTLRSISIWYESENEFDLLPLPRYEGFADFDVGDLSSPTGGTGGKFKGDVFK